jgi:hypothetical protein
MEHSGTRILGSDGEGSALERDSVARRDEESAVAVEGDGGGG